MTAPLVLIVMGVSGAGKSTLAEGLRDRLGWPFQEGDDLHPEANRRKMASGQPLTDADRAPWLDAVKAWIDARVEAGEPGLITCSALKRRYREHLVAERHQVRLLYLKAKPETLEARVKARHHAFMPAHLLHNQLQTLEEPQQDERPLVVRMDGTPQATLEEAIEVVRAAERQAG